MTLKQSSSSKIDVEHLLLIELTKAVTGRFLWSSGMKQNMLMKPIKGKYDIGKGSTLNLFT